MKDLLPESFGLSPCLYVPIAVADEATLERMAGVIVERKVSRQGRANALLVKTRLPSAFSSEIPLWSAPQAGEWKDRLFPDFQVWVHVDYHGYRSAWRLFGMPDPGSEVLDHVSNRRCIRIRGRAHPYIRICPVSRQVNSSGGGAREGEGMEYDFWKNLLGFSPEIQEEARKANRIPWVLADPMDLTKILDIAPGAISLDGVRDSQIMFYPPR